MIQNGNSVSYIFIKLLCFNLKIKYTFLLTLPALARTAALALAQAAQYAGQIRSLGVVELVDVHLPIALNGGVQLLDEPLDAPVTATRCHHQEAIGALVGHHLADGGVQV